MGFVAHGPLRTWIAPKRRRLARAGAMTDLSSPVDVAVLGGGFFGCEIALALKRMGLGRVVLIEREPGIMRRASAVNQARIHNGYHYPRALLTAARSRLNFDRFLGDYGHAILPGMEKVYAIARTSRVNASQFSRFCETIGAPCREARHSIARLFDAGMIEDAFETRELVFDAIAVAARLETDLA
ncbi:MAG: FAD-dependent oxidoreductase, partial [Bradyrhizobium sp.]